MDYENMTAQDFKDEMVQRREKIYRKIDRVGSIDAEKILFDEYLILCEDAAGGDPIAQDLLAQWFRNGNQIIPENIEMSYKWLFLAGANGNKFSLDRLKLHFGYSFDQIIALEDFGELAYKNDINENNYQYVLGKLLCDAVIDDMQINALELAKQKPTYLPFSSIILRNFDRATNRAVEIVTEYLRKV